jgi:D-psicose/D-tagatose/L-ribulose 3-epimerase
LRDNRRIAGTCGLEFQEGEEAMKYGVNTMVWTTHISGADGSLFRRIKQWGFEGVELFVSPQEPVDIPAVRQILDDLELGRAACVVPTKDSNLVSAQPEVRAQGAEFLNRCAERAAELGARMMCGPLYAGLGVMTGARRTEQEWEWAKAGLRAAARRAQELGVDLCIEPLNRFETYFLNTQQDAARLVREVEMPNVRVHYDTFHANIEESRPVESLRALGKELGHVHISENNRGIPGTGHVDWRGTLSTLKDMGYDGWLTIESFAEPAPELAAAASIWRDLAPSGDELASQGLWFLKGLSRELQIQ